MGWCNVLKSNNLRLKINSSIAVKGLKVWVILSISAICVIFASDIKLCIVVNTSYLNADYLVKLYTVIIIIIIVSNHISEILVRSCLTCFFLSYGSLYYFLHVFKSLLVMVNERVVHFRDKVSLEGNSSLITPDICLFMQSVENDLRADQSSQPGVLIVETESFYKKTAS